MTKVVLPMKEERYRVIKAVVNGGTSVQPTAIKLNRSEQIFYRLSQRYKQQGKDGFIHGNTCREPANKRNAQLERRIIHLYTNKYADFNIAHFHKFLTTDEQIAISEPSLRLLFRHQHIVSPNAHKSTKRELKPKKNRSCYCQNVTKPPYQPLKTSKPIQNVPGNVTLVNWCKWAPRESTGLATRRPLYTQPLMISPGTLSAATLPNRKHSAAIITCLPKYFAIMALQQNS